MTAPDLKTNRDKHFGIFLITIFKKESRFLKDAYEHKKMDER